MSRELHLNLFVHTRGHHESAWRHPDASPLALTDFNYYRRLADLAEGAAFDAVFLADVLALGQRHGHSAQGGLEPLTLLGALSSVTSRIGLIATASTTYTEPYNLARQFASLDHLSNGRVGWNIVTSWAPAAAANFGHVGQVGHGERYERAEDFLQAVTALWDSWDDDAVLDDRAGGVYFDPAKIRPIHHDGPWSKVEGPLNIPRGPQGRPVYVQAGSSEPGRRFGATWAEAIFTAHTGKGSAKEFYSAIKQQAQALGRRPDHVVILPGISATIGSTEAEAHRVEAELAELNRPETGLQHLSNRFGGHDFTALPLDRPLAAGDFPDPTKVEASLSRAQGIARLALDEGLTLRQLLTRLAGARGHFATVGTPEQIADTIEDWFQSGAADGFNVMPPILPAQFELFTEEVVPLLRRRGLFRSEYRGETLRQHLGLPRPEAGSPAADRARRSA